MVRLHTSLLALTLVTGLVLASSDDYQRRGSDELFERDLDAEELFFRQYYDLFDERSDTFDELEARGFLGLLMKGAEAVGKKVGKKAIKDGIGKAMKGTARKSSRSIGKQLKRGAKQANSNSNGNNRQSKANQDRIRQTVQTIFGKFRYDPIRSHIVQARGLEEDEELSQRDLDDEEVFGREIDILDERDTFDDLD